FRRAARQAGRRAPWRGAAAAPETAAPMASPPATAAGRRARLPASSVSRQGSFMAVGDRIGARRYPVELALDVLPGRLECRGVGIARDDDRPAGDGGDAPERQIDRGAIPILELDAMLRRHRHDVD